MYKGNSVSKKIHYSQDDAFRTALQDSIRRLVGL